MNEFEKELFKNKVSLSRFINICLYKKEYGFYQKNKIGKHFVTSPEISQLFGECISIFFMTFYKQFKIKSICELGPGNGTLTKDLIFALSKFIDYKLSFNLYEKSEYLRKIQTKNLIDLDSNKISINFLKNLKLSNEPYFFICNEFFDALPINQYERINESWFEKKVIFRNKLKIINEKTDFKPPQPAKHGDIVEISPLTNLYLRKIFKHLQNFGGAILIFDYGPFEKQKISTIQAIYKSKKCGVLDFPLRSDITYHVDFVEMKKLSAKFNLFCYGPITQREFLFFHGINERVMNLLLKIRSRSEIEAINSQFERLTSPNGMGNLIKCLFISNYKFDSKIFKSYAKARTF